MRIALLVFLVPIFFVSAFLPAAIVLGGGNPEELKSEYNRHQMITAANPVERYVNRAFLWFANRRAFFAVPSALGILLTFLWPT